MTRGANEPAVRLRWGLVAVAAIGALLVVLGFLVDPGRAAFSYLAAVVFVVSVALGLLALVMIQNVIGSVWFVPLRRIAEAGAMTLPLLGVLFVPVLASLGLLFPWVDPSLLGPAVAERLARKKAWLDPAFFAVRAAAFFVAWSASAWLLWRSSLAQDGAREHAAGAHVARQRILSLLLLPVFAITMALAAVDWMVSLDVEWSSSMFGVYWFAIAMVAGCSALVLLSWATLPETGEGAPEAPGDSHYHALGKLLLTFVCFEAYVAFAQYLLVWIADLPAEAGWFAVRSRGGWGVLGAIVAAGGMAAPLLALLSWRLKRSRAALAAVAAWTLLFRYLEIYWIVVPACRGGACGPSWMDVAAICGVGAVWVLAFAGALAGHASMPLGDPRSARALRYTTR